MRSPHASASALAFSLVLCASAASGQERRPAPPAASYPQHLSGQLREEAALWEKTRRELGLWRPVLGAEFAAKLKREREKLEAIRRRAKPSATREEGPAPALPSLSSFEPLQRRLQALEARWQEVEDLYAPLNNLSQRLAERRRDLPGEGDRPALLKPFEFELLLQTNLAWLRILEDRLGELRAQDPPQLERELEALRRELDAAQGAPAASGPGPTAVALDRGDATSAVAPEPFWIAERWLARAAYLLAGLAALLALVGFLRLRHLSIRLETRALPYTRLRGSSFYFLPRLVRHRRARARRRGPVRELLPTAGPGRQLS